MQRICFRLLVRPERLEEYKQRHKAVWPEMLQALRDAGWANYSLFLGEDGLLIGYLESSNFQLAMDALGRMGINTLWQREMAPFFTDQEGKLPDKALLQLKEIFHLD